MYARVGVHPWDGTTDHLPILRTPAIAALSTVLDFYGITGSAANLTRVTVDGEAQNTNGFLKVTVNRPGADSVLSWTRVPYTS